VGKIIVPILSIFTIAVIFLSFADNTTLITIKKGNLNQQPLEIIQNKMQDADCGMVIESLKFTSQVIDENGNTWFFHDIGGMINWIERKKFVIKPIIWVYTLDTNQWIDGYRAFYSINENTPMKYGFGAYENKRKHLITFDDMRLRMLRGENLTNPIIRKKVLGENTS
jgi:hypothetical protein